MHDATKGPFISGVVEGFYGRPWTPEQRKELFRRLRAMGMNTYLYAPKDDVKHRAYWRDLYTVEETEHLRVLIEAAKEQNITFYYALSPGLDITYSSSRDVLFIKQKLEQVQSLGCEAFALLFDDIEPHMNETDKQLYSSFAAAHVSVTNEVYEHLRQPSFMFCPTEYCESRAVPDLKTSEYLNIVGQKLVPAINVLWTGPRVISRLITVDHVKTVSSVIRRLPTIWDNVHANDYDQKRVFLGPYKGRPTSIKEHIAGVVTNPNCEFEANFVAMHSLAHWCRCVRDGKLRGSSKTYRKRRHGSEENALAAAGVLSQGDYHPSRALQLAISDWLPEISTPRSAYGDTSYQRKPPAALETQISIAPTAYSATETVTATLDNGAVGEAAAQDASQVSDETLMAPVVEPVNSLVDAYDEPMELAPVGSALHRTLPVATTEDTEMAPAATPFKEDDDGLKADSVKTGTMDTAPSSPAPLLAEAVMTQNDSGSPRICDADGESSANLSLPVTTLDVLMDHQEFGGLSRSEVELLIQLFYLPFEHGAEGTWFLGEFLWLRSSGHVVYECRQSGECAKMTEWMRRFREFNRRCSDVCQLFVSLAACANRGLVYDLYPYVWEATSILLLLNAFLKWQALGFSKPASPAILPEDDTGGQQPLNGSALPKEKTVSSLEAHWDPDNENGYDCEPWQFRGGLLTEFQRVLPLETCQDLFTARPPHPPSSQIVAVRPYRNATDWDSVCSVCKRISASSDASMSDFEIERLISGFVTYSPEYCFVVKEGGVVIGFGAAALDSKQFHQVLQKEFWPKFREQYAGQERNDTEIASGQKHFEEEFSVAESVYARYPSVVCIRVLGTVLDTAAPKRLAVALLSALKANGSRGVFCEVRRSDKQLLDLYTRLGFFEVTMLDEEGSPTMYLGRIL